MKLKWNSRFFVALLGCGLFFSALESFAGPQFGEVAVFEAINESSSRAFLSYSFFKFITKISSQNSFTVIDISGEELELKNAVQDPHTQGIFWLSHATADGDLVSADGNVISQNIFSDKVGSALKFVMCLSCMGEKVERKYQRAAGVNFYNSDGLLSGLEVPAHFGDFPGHLGAIPSRRTDKISPQMMTSQSKLYPNGDLYFIEDAKPYTEGDYLNGEHVDSIIDPDFIDAALGVAQKMGFRILFFRGSNVEAAIESIRSRSQTSGIFIHSKKAYELTDKRIRKIPDHLGDFSREVVSYTERYKKQDLLKEYLELNFHGLKLENHHTALLCPRQLSAIESLPQR